MSSSFGKNIVVTIFGESHGNSIGVVIDGLPIGEKIDLEKLNEFMSRRAPGKNKYGTKRKERDLPKFIAGVQDGKIVANTICAVIENSDQRSSDYEQFKDTPRPSHADYVAYMKYGTDFDMRGSGSFSGRLTAPLCIAGGIAKQILEKKGIEVQSHINRVGGISDIAIDYANPDMEALKECAKKEIPVVSESAEEEIKNLINRMRDEENSVGAEIECFATGLPVGLGEPNYDSFDAVLAKLIFSIPAVRGFSFGSGFDAVSMTGKEHNDEYVLDGGVKTNTNNAGGVVGGITNGMPIVFRTAIKPTASIGFSQRSFSISESVEKDLEIKGRHDPCIGIRILPVIESMCALAILDFMEY
ncbi:chorismate synthase [Peptoniphilus asaccharolyticus]